MQNMSLQETAISCTSHSNEEEDLLNQMRIWPEIRKDEDCFPKNVLHSKQRLHDTRQKEATQEIQAQSEQQLNEDVADIRWCGCGNCTPMPSLIEHLCCHEQPIIFSKIPDERNCITECKFFNELISRERADLNFKMTTLGLRKQPNDAEYTRGLRKASYRNFSVWIYGNLGTSRTKPIPSCVVKVIRSSFPDPQSKNIGFL
ncbi:P2X purinoceptor 7-like [Xenopus laevis]|uniref:P2X purinoceptor 7-like n=1 Tax=Xenopus laevis TaxID=8355 RepID=A0A8J0TGE8_XENLA|nr:P2X purinoceptor 7-like [Xenopus laevis]